MLKAISRYGVRVVPGTVQRIAELEAKGQLLDGPHLAAFESAFAARLGRGRAISTSYGRMAFYYILKALDLPAGGEVVFPALTFWVMPEMARVLGLTPVFADVDPVSFNMTRGSLARAITPRTVAIVPTHLWGLPCDMDEILELARQHGLRVIEDCAHALGAQYRGRPAGTFGDAAIFSFQALKPLNAYGGGMALVHDPDLAGRVADLAGAEPAPDLASVRKRLWQGRVLRIATRPAIFTWTLFPIMSLCARLGRSLDVYFWEAIRPLDPLPADYRQRFSNVQAALALDGLERLDDWTGRTVAHARRMSAILQHVPGVRVPAVPADRTHAFYQYCAYVPARDAVVNACLRQRVDIETLHVDVCTELDLFRASRAAAPGAIEATRTIQIPVYEGLDEAQVERVAAVVRDAVLSTDALEGTAVRQS